MLCLFVLSALVATTLAAGIPPRVPMLDGRIVGGEETNIKLYPHQVSLEYFGSHICGGSLISTKHVVTAAHCTDGSSASDLSVRAGTSFKGSGGVTVSVLRIMQHQSYDRVSIDYDITVLELSSELTTGATIDYIQLAEHEESPGTFVAVTGWGTLSEGGSSPSKLQRVSLRIVTKETCTKAYGQEAITDRMLCAGGRGGKDACQGDSGGPMIYDGKPILLGIVSWGYGCGREGYPGVYTNVANLLEWIESHAVVQKSM